MSGVYTVGVNLAPYIAAYEQALLEAGLKIQLHPNSTSYSGQPQPNPCNSITSLDCTSSSG